MTTADTGEANLEIVKRYLQAITDGVPFEELKEFFAPDVVQREFPNRLVPAGATRGLAELADAHARGRTVVTRQRFDLKSAVAVGDRVAVEVEWRGTLAVPFGTIPVGGELTANFGVFFEMSEGRIRSQNNYDCFDPW